MKHLLIEVRGTSHHIKLTSHHTGNSSTSSKSMDMISKNMVMIGDWTVLWCHNVTNSSNRSIYHRSSRNQNHSLKRVMPILTVQKNKKIVDDLNAEDMRGIHTIKSQVPIDTDNLFMIGMECLVSEERGILLQLTLMIHIMIDMHSHISMKSSLITTLTHTTPILILQYMNIQLLIPSTMVLYINHAIQHMVDIVSLLVDTQLGILILLVDMVVGICATMSLVNTAIKKMNSIGLSIVQNSLKRQEPVVKSLFPCGEETDKRSDAATAKNVRANGSLFVHLAL